MIIGVDPASRVPPYEQVRDQLAAAIDSGELGIEQRLPTVRKLAADLGLAVNTVARAYRELEQAGRIESRGRRGSFVAGSYDDTRSEAVAATRDFTSRMQHLGVGPHELLAIVRRELDADLAVGGVQTRPTGAES
jgi:DNA-binding transcriptional regulator YhcF (GntR family)